MKNIYFLKTFRSNFNLIIVLVLLFNFNTDLFAQIDITKPNLNISACGSFPSNYFSLNDIVLEEIGNGNRANFSTGTNLTLILSTPSNFQFQPAIGNVTYTTSRNITSASITITATQITITYTVAGTNRNDILTISGIQIRAINTASTQNITRTGGTGTINGLTNGTTLTNNLSSVISTIPTVANAGPNQTLSTCVTNTVLNANNPTVGTGLWSVVSGTATITTPTSRTSTVTGLAFGATATLRWTISNGSCTASTSDMTITTAIANYSCLNYCTPTGNLDCATRGDYISNVTLNTLVNNSTCSAGGYIVYPVSGTQTTSVTRGNTYNLSIRTGPGNKKHGLGVWIDFNQNSSFADAGEYFSYGNNVIANSINTITITIPAGASLGTTRMRVRYGRQTNVSSTSSCSMNGSFGETEDYGITIINPIPCVSPSVKPTALILNANGTSITGSFTAPIPAPDNYLVVRNTTGIAPNPISGTTYAIGGTVGAGNIVVDNDSNIVFVANGLISSTTYYFFIFPFNSACAGGPTYNSSTPLNGSATTLAGSYCIPSVGSGYEAFTHLYEVNFIGTLNDVSNISTYSSSPRGYQDFTGLSNLAIQAQGEGVNISLQASYLSFVNAWVDWDKDGVFADPGEKVYSTGIYSVYSTTFGFIIPPTTPVGNYRIRIRTNDPDIGSSTYLNCGNINNWGETEDYLFSVVAKCNAVISSVTDGRTCGSGTVSLTALSLSSGVTQYRWYATPTGASLITTTSSGAWNTPILTTSTTYYVTAFNGCESLERTAVNAIISPIPTLTYTPINPIVCGEDIVLNLSATGDKEEVFLINEKFNSGLGIFTNTNIATSASDAITQWQNKTSTFVPNQAVWFPAISSGINSNKFAYSTSDVSGVTVHNQLASAAVNTTNFLDLTLRLKMYYSHYTDDGVNPNGDYVTIDVYNGTSWVEIKKYIEDVGIGTRFETVTFDLSAFVNITNLQIRVRYYAYWSDGVAVDDIQLYGFRPIGTALNWTSSSTVNAFTNSACTIPYVQNTPALNVYIKPSLTQLETGTYSFTANTVLANGCTTSKDINVTNRSKIWQGNSTDWNDPANWKPSNIPAITDCIVIPVTPNNPIISGANYQAFGRNIKVKDNANLLVNSSNNITINEEVIIGTNSLIELQNTSSLVQNVDTSINSGSIKMTRTTRPMTRWAYVYWGSPIAENVFSQIPTQFDLKYRWVSGTSAGTWASLTSTTSGEGFITRVKNIAPFSTGTGTINFIYTGTPKNGVVNVNVDSFDSSSLVAGNTVLLANPYPSTVDAAKFLLHPNNTELGGTLFFWTSLTLYSGTGSYAVTDYGSWNLSGGTGTAPATDPTNLSLKPNGKIVAGQGFFAQAFADGQITFNNSMREANNNSQFFRTTDETTDEKNRIWLNLYSNTTFRQMLVGYNAGATDGFDKYYDGDSFTNNPIDIYSLLDNRKLVIQSKALPFNESDSIPLGYRVTTAGNYHIAIDELDGIFSGNQNVYLRDNLLGIDHDLKANPYTFITTAGSFDNRFEIVYTTNALGVTEVKDSTTFGMINDQLITINSSEIITSITVFDITGKMILNSDSLSTKQFTQSFNHANGIYIAKVKLDNGFVANVKLIK